MNFKCDIMSKIKFLEPNMLFFLYINTQLFFISLNALCHNISFLTIYIYIHIYSYIYIYVYCILFTVGWFISGRID